MFGIIMIGRRGSPASTQACTSIALGIALPAGRGCNSAGTRDRLLGPRHTAQGWQLGRQLQRRHRPRQLRRRGAAELGRKPC